MLNLPTIDLHSAGDVTTALEQLEKGLFLLFKKQERTCRVVYGIGEGVLRRAVLEALERNPMVKEVREGESGGSCVVVM